MNGKCLYSAICFLAVAEALCAEQPPTTPQPINIPLDRVWAFNMPGTRDIQKLEPSIVTHQPDLKRLLPEIIKAISPYEKSIPPEMTTQKPGFAIAAIEDEALREVYDELVREVPRSETITVDDEVSLVFFAGEFTQGVNLEKIERDGNTITLSYHFVPRLEQVMSSQLAIIPIGKLPNAGEYKVTLEALPLENRLFNQGFRPVDDKVRQTILCEPFTFRVETD